MEQAHKSNLAVITDVHADMSHNCAWAELLQKTNALPHSSGVVLLGAAPLTFSIALNVCAIHVGTRNSQKHAPCKMTRANLLEMPIPGRPAGRCPERFRGVYTGSTATRSWPPTSQKHTTQHRKKSLHRKILPQQIDRWRSQIQTDTQDAIRTHVHRYGRRWTTSPRFHCWATIKQITTQQKMPTEIQPKSPYFLPPTDGTKLIMPTLHQSMPMLCQPMLQAIVHCQPYMQHVLLPQMLDLCDNVTDMKNNCH